MAERVWSRWTPRNPRDRHEVPLSFLGSRCTRGMSASLGSLVLPKFTYFVWFLGSLGSLDFHAHQRHNKVPVIPGNSWGSQQPDIRLRCLGFLETIGKPFSKFWRSCVSPLITMVYVTHLFFGVLISSFWWFTPIASLVWCKWCKWIWWCEWCPSTLV